MHRQGQDHHLPARESHHITLPHHIPCETIFTLYHSHTAGGRVLEERGRIMCQNTQKPLE